MILASQSSRPAVTSKLGPFRNFRAHAPMLLSSRGQVGEWLKPTDCKSVPHCEVRRFESFPVHHAFRVASRTCTIGIVSIDERLEFLVRSTKSQHASLQELHAVVAQH